MAANLTGEAPSTAEDAPKGPASKRLASKGVDIPTLLAVLAVAMPAFRPLAWAADPGTADGWPATRMQGQQDFLPASLTISLVVQVWEAEALAPQQVPAILTVSVVVRNR